MESKNEPEKTTNETPIFAPSFTESPRVTFGNEEVETLKPTMFDMHLNPEVVELLPASKAKEADGPIEAKASPFDEFF